MYIVKSCKESNQYVREWLTLRGLSVLGADDLPKIGYIAFERGEPIAAGYIRRVEGGTGLIDSLITNPDAPGDMRSSAIDLVVEHLLQTAIKANIHRLLAYSVDSNTLLRAEKRFGFSRLPHTVICADLRKKDA